MSATDANPEDAKDRGASASTAPDALQSSGRELVTAAVMSDSGLVGGLRREGSRSAFLFEPDTIPPGVRCLRCGRRHLIETLTAIIDQAPAGPLMIAPLVVATVVCSRCSTLGTLVISSTEREAG